MRDAFEKLQDIVKFLEKFERAIDVKRIITLLNEKGELYLSRLCEEAGFTDTDYGNLFEMALKSFWTGTLKVDTVSTLTDIIRSFKATENRRRSIDGEILRYWGKLPEAPAGKPSTQYHLFSVPYGTHEVSWLLHHAMDVKLALRLLKKKGFIPAGLRELVAGYKAKPKVYPPEHWRDQHIDDGSLIAPGDCFAEKYPLIYIGTQMAKSWGRVPGDILSSYTGDITISPEKDYLLVRKVS